MSTVMKAAELRNTQVPELRLLLSSLMRQRFKIRLAQASSEFTQTHTIKVLRRNIARIESILTEKGKE